VKELMPQAEIVVIPDADHALPLQNPSAIAREIASFVKRSAVMEPV
jgi:pimeloyl-ACP methyl ester carboxylesterase